MHAIWHAVPGTAYFDVVELLVEAGADVNVRRPAPVAAPSPGPRLFLCVLLVALLCCGVWRRR